MKSLLYSVAVFLFGASSVIAADNAKPATDAKAPDNAAPARRPGEYTLGPDSLPQEHVPQGRLEGPLLFRSAVFTNTVRQYWIYVPAQYTPQKPACVLVFQDGQRAVRTNGSLRVPQVMDNLIAKG